MDVSGAYQLKVRSSEENKNSGIYRIEIKALRTAGNRDQMRVIACRRLSNAIQLRHQWKEAALKSAAGEYEKAARSWGLTGDRPLEALVLKHAGDIWEILSERQRALTCYRQAQAIYGQLGDQSGEIRITNAISALSINQGSTKSSERLHARTNGN